MDIPLWAGGILATLVTCVLVAHYYYKNAFSYWQDRGVKGPKAYPLVGNLIQLMFNRSFAKRWSKVYGKVYGIYWGTAPVLAVNDAEAVRKILIKDFDKFPNHKLEKILTELQRNSVFSQQNGQWRRVRAIMSPTFTSGKMRRMTKLLNQCADDLLDSFDEWLEAGKQQVNLKEVFSLYTMDAISSCCYGLKMQRYKAGDSLKTTRDDFVRDAMRIFEFKIWRMLTIFCLNERILQKLEFNIVPNSTLDGFASRIEQIIKNRRESGRNFDDYLQILLEAELDGSSRNVPDDSMDAKESHHAGSLGDQLQLRPEEFDQIKERTLSEPEVLSNAMFLLVVGLETTSTLLANCFYALAFHPKVAKKLYEAVKPLAIRDERTGQLTFDYDALTSCQYLDAVVSETLRALTPVSQTDRVAEEDYHLESHNVHLSKGSRVVVMLDSLMNDPDYWPEPDKFEPERFMPENQHKIVPGSFCPFGLGPRHCLGMRFSLTESKLAIAKLILNFTFSPTPGTQYPPQMKANLGLCNLKTPIVEVTRRLDTD